MTIESERERAEVVGPEGYITKKELARRIKKTVRTVEHWQRKGVLPYVKIGNSVLFSWPDVQAHLQSNFRVCQPRLEKAPVNA